MSSKSIKFGNNVKSYDLTYDNVDNWPNNPDMKTYNNISLIFSPNSNYTVSASSDQSNVSYSTVYVTDFANK